MWSKEKVRAPLSISIGMLFLLNLNGCDGRGTDGNKNSSGSGGDGYKPSAQQLSDVEYLEKNYSSESESSCASEADEYLRSIAKFDFGWDDDAKGMFGSKFNKYMKYVSESGVITLVSDRSKLQNGFGAWQHVSIYCRYDTQAKKVLGFDSTPPIPMNTATNIEPSDQLVPPSPVDAKDEPTPVGTPSARVESFEAPATEQPVVPRSPQAPKELDCSVSRDGISSMVCSNPSLRDRNSRITSIFRSLLSRSTPGARDQFLQEQDLWFKERNDCSSQSCLADVYSRRMHAVTTEAWAQYNSQHSNRAQQPTEPTALPS